MANEYAEAVEQVPPVERAGWTTPTLQRLGLSATATGCTPCPDGPGSIASTS